MSRVSFLFYPKWRATLSLPPQVSFPKFLSYVWHRLSLHFTRTFFSWNLPRRTCRLWLTSFGTKRIRSEMLCAGCSWKSAVLLFLSRVSSLLILVQSSPEVEFCGYRCYPFLARLSLHVSLPLLLQAFLTRQKRIFISESRCTVRTQLVCPSSSLLL